MWDSAWIKHSAEEVFKRWVLWNAGCFKIHFELGIVGCCYICVRGTMVKCLFKSFLHFSQINPRFGLLASEKAKRKLAVLLLDRCCFFSISIVRKRANFRRVRLFEVSKLKIINHLRPRILKPEFWLNESLLLPFRKISNYLRFACVSGHCAPLFKSTFYTKTTFRSGASILQVSLEETRGKDPTPLI